MGFFDFLDNFVKKEKEEKATIRKTTPLIIEIPTNLSLKEMALYTATSILANAISGCEFRVYEKGKRVKNIDWYRLNIEPNKNENASLFWNKVVNKMMRDKKGALVVLVKGELLCAKSFDVEEHPIDGNIYTNVTLDGGYKIDREFRHYESLIFKLEEESAKKFIDGINRDYEELFESAARAFKESNGTKYKLKVNSIKTGDKDFADEYENYIKDELESYLKNEHAIYVEYEGYELEKEDKRTEKSAEDITRIKKDIFEMIGQALKIPNALMKGDVTAIKDVTNVFLTFGVDPIAEMIQKVLNKRMGAKKVLSGNYYTVYTGKIKHRDTLEDAIAIDKLISSGFASIDEIREEEGYEELNEPWSKEHYITKNYAKMEDGLTEKGGERDDENTKIESKL